MDQGIISIIIMGIVTENITHTFQRGNIFKKVRNVFEGRSAYLHELLNCPLCLSFWVAIGVALIPTMLPNTAIIVLILAVHAAARYVSSLMFWLNKI